MTGGLCPRLLNYTTACSGHKPDPIYPKMKSKTFVALITVFALLILTTSASTQKLSPDEILKKAGENGKDLLAALRHYTYYAELTLETINQADIITGKYYRFSAVSYDKEGKRQEKLFEQKSSLPEDAYIGSNSANNLVRVYHFMVTPETLAQYEFNYIGREQVDELNTYVFDVKPKIQLPDPRKSSDRYLKGRVWIDDRDLQVVKVAGNAVPEQNDHRTPHFETYFQNYDQYWFPSYTSADDQVRVNSRLARVIVKARFTGYKKTSQ